MNRKSYSKAFCFLLLIFMCVAGGAAFAASEEANEEVKAADSSEQATKDVTEKMESVDTGKWTIKTGNWFKDLLTKGAKLFIKKIREAEKELKKAKSEFENSREQVKGSSNSAKDAKTETKDSVKKSEAAFKDKNLDKASDSRSAAQKGLKVAGEKIDGLADIMQKIAEKLHVIGERLEQMRDVKYVGKLCSSVGRALKLTASLINKTCAVMKVAAKSLEEASHKGKLSDEDFKKFASEAAEAWKNSGDKPVIKKEAISEESEAENEKKDRIVIEGIREESSEEENADGIDIVEEPDLPPGMREENEDEDEESDFDFKDMISEGKDAIDEIKDAYEDGKTELKELKKDFKDVRKEVKEKWDELRGKDKKDEGNNGGAGSSNEQGNASALPASSAADSRSLSGAQWIGPNGSGAQVTANLSANTHGHFVDFDYPDSVKSWRPLKGDLNAYGCCFVERDGKLVGGKFEWIRVGQKRKLLDNITNGYIRGVKPRKGEKVYFCLLSLDGKQRTNLVEATWP